MGGTLSNSRGKEAGSALLASCAEGDSITALKMLESHKRLAVWTNWADGASPLHVAIVNGHTELCRDILASARSYLESKRKAKGAARAMVVFVNMRSTLGQTPLEVACKFGHADIVSLLLEHGANALLQDSVHSRTCLHYAAIHGHAACIDILLADNTMGTRAGQTVLLREACMVDGRQMYRYVDAPAALGFAPLHLAVGHGHRRATQSLLQGGAKLDVRCKGHMFLTYAPPGRYKPQSTPLHIAAFSQNLPLCHAILSSQVQRNDEGADDLRSLADGSGHTPHELVDHFPALAALLDPQAPLAPALEAAQLRLMTGGARAPDSLAHLAANQLRRLLVGQLETIPARRRQSQALLQRPLHSMVPAGEAPRASKDWPLVSDEEECEICFMHALACDFATCSHGVCKDCALALCGQVEDGNTPACPFCRSTIGGFTAHGRAGQTFKRFSC